ncbi:MAG: ParB N-terminal domain-containing protein [Lachnospiraceae bacterium]|nr:ParB N-terminal domain-containing protein [Butyrivibrio sp.]MCM1344856.1 ParB N-terminal domain-containing protein [Muribaculaceae bacterium]MCM1411779.1 ParB N-terminal domain-containing protein [Lachnospiraceae bacterium]
MKVPIGKIQIKEGRRSLDTAHAEELAASIRELGLLNPVTIDRENNLIAGLHRLEAVRLLGWTEVECTVSSLEGLKAELAEIDENIVRSDISALEYGEILLRRKEIYETLHPEAKHGGDRRSDGIKTTKCRFENTRSFAEDTAEKLGVTRRTVERQIQMAKNLAPEAKDIIRDTDTRLSKKAAMKLSRLEPEQQKEAVGLLAAKEIKTVEEYTERTGERKQAGTGLENTEKTDREAEIQGREPEETANGKETEDIVFRGTALKDTAGSEKGQQAGQGCPSVADKSTSPVSPMLDVMQGNDHNERKGTSFRDLVAELKDPDKDCSGTPESFLEEYAAFVRKFHREIGWYDDPYYDTVYPYLDGGQLASLREMTQAICFAAEGILHKVERMAKK